MTYAELVKKHRLVLASTPARANPNLASERDQVEMDHWHCALSGPGLGGFLFHFSQGRGYRKADRATHFKARQKGCDFPNQERPFAQPRTVAELEFNKLCEPQPPHIVAVLESLAGDVRTVKEPITFEEWAGDLGYDTDSRRAEKTFNIIRDYSARLYRALGPETYRELLEAEEEEL